LYLAAGTCHACKMQLTPDSAAGNTIRSYSPGEIRLRDETLRSNVIISRDQLIRDWNPPPVAELSIADFTPVLELEPEIILFGTGSRQQFPAFAVLTELLHSGVAIEVMETSAACRTFNVLIGEYRSAVAALLIE
jgi:uncharacterized protein